MTLWLTLMVACTTLALHSGTIASSDGISTYEVARSLVDHGDVAIDRGVVWHGWDGRFYSPFGIGLSLVAVIPYAVVTIARLALAVPELFAQAAVASAMPLVVGLLAAATYLLARRLSGTVVSSTVVALGAVGGTFLAVYAKDFFSEPLAALCVVFAIERAIAGRSATSGIALAAAAITRPQFVTVAPILLWRIQRDSGWPSVARAAVPLATGLLIDTGYNVIRFRDPLNFGYSTPELQQGFTTPFPEGALGLLFHPEKSVFLFAPIVALVPLGLWRLWHANRTAFWLIAGNLSITFVLSATWWAWGGGWVWGPRLLIPGLIPAIASLAPWSDVGRWRTWLLGGLIILGAGMNVSGVLVDVGAQLSDHPPPAEGPRPDRQLVLVPSVAASTVQHLYERSGSDRSASLDLWQVKVAREWGPRGLLGALLATGILLAGAVIATLMLHRELRGVPNPYTRAPPPAIA